MTLHINLAPLPSGTPTPIPEDEEYYSSWSLFLVCVLLVLSLWTSYYLQIKKIKTVHETLVSIFAGMTVGLIVRLAPGTMIREMLTFKHTLFFNLLLPPIILNSGYELKQANFFRNFGSILIFAFLGTFISAVGVGLLVYIWSFLGLESLNIGPLECLIFGSTLSATDPVTILAIFNQYKVDPKLYTVIFGESLLNDAVSIVMYETLTQFHGTEVYLKSIFHGIGIFLLNFSISMALGVAFGLGMSLLLKHSYLHYYPSIESCLVALCAYTCYFFSNGLSMSGIVSLLFCGITLKHYAYHTMSRRTQRATKYIFSTLAQLSENFIFIYLGMALFTSAPVSEPVFSYVKPLFILITTVAVVFTRYVAVFPLSTAINFFHKHVRGQRTEELPHSYQMMLFWAGLRGAVGVALAAGFKGPNAQMMRTTVLAVVVLTVLLFGGTTARMLEVLGIRTGVEDEEGASSDEDEGPPFFANGTPRSSSSGYLVRSARGRGNWSRYWDEHLQESSALSPTGGSFGPPTAAAAAAAARVGSHYAARFNFNHHYQEQDASPHTRMNTGAQVFSAASSDSYDSDGAEVLPLAPTAVQHDPEMARDTSNSDNTDNNTHPPRRNLSGLIGEDGRWFQNLDERYLLPLFSNATASRTFHARKSARKASGRVGGSGMDSPNRRGNASGVRSGMATPADSDDELFGSGEAVNLTPSNGGGGGDGTSGGNGNNGGGGSSGSLSGLGISTRRGALVDESRTARGLASPTLRGSASASPAPWDTPR
ncbi:sodium/hydrogen exchanger [Macrolepiota fuliginosa MF-IS2]|uniref:Sodium/hydrogen exchanger n=1 Tax=Macrolepiota fuliginosa MF-IS2 TaxID=1400762 RepID=A0A9P5XGX7_9AGAR|nr:sodium/hydrogen exchanger [Macrolepiota fuliginosa MF-IS2]